MLIDMGLSGASATQNSERTATDRFMQPGGRNFRQTITHSGSVGGDLVVVEEASEKPKKVYLRQSYKNFLQKREKDS